MASGMAYCPKITVGISNAAYPARLKQSIYALFTYIFGVRRPRRGEMRRCRKIVQATNPERYGASRLAVRYEPIVALRLDPQNPRLHSRKQLRQIGNSIASFGFNVPVLIDAEQSVIAGHGRVEGNAWIVEEAQRVPLARCETQEQDVSVGARRAAAVFDGAPRSSRPGFRARETVEQRTLTPSILVRIQVPQPYKILILLWFVSFALRRNSSGMSAGYSAFITMVRFRDAKPRPGAREGARCL